MPGAGSRTSRLKTWAREEGVAPASADWAPTADATRKWGREYPRWPSYVTVTTLFGGWNEGLAAAGLRPRRQRWEPDAIVAALRGYAECHECGIHFRLPVTTTGS